MNAVSCDFFSSSFYVQINTRHTLFRRKTAGSECFIFNIKYVGDNKKLSCILLSTFKVTHAFEDEQTFNKPNKPKTNHIHLIV